MRLMKTVHKLILKSYLGPMIVTFFLVMFVLLLQFMWRYIDELVGKGLGLDVIAELMFYVSATMIPMALPLATLLAAIMTMGNLGEHYELLALKSAGISLPRILKPLIIVVFFVANNLVPYSTQKMFALLYDVRQQKQSLEFKDGIFFNGIENMSIRVSKQNPRTKLLTEVLIYDTRDLSGNMTTTVADSGYITLSDDKKYLLVTLFHGHTYENSRNYTAWSTGSTLRHNIFDEQKGVIPLSGFDFERTDQSLFSNNSQTKNLRDLEVGIDSLQRLSDQTSSASYGPLMQTYLFPQDQSFVSDTLPRKTGLHRYDVRENIPELDVRKKKELYETAIRNAQNAENSYTFDETLSKDAITQLYRYQIEWHHKMSLPVSIMIFFLIGAPLGAIIRKGGLGTPIVVSVAFFVVYYIISMTGEKMAREGSWSSTEGVWISSFILLPISIYLTWKATNDSNLFNAEWYFMQLKKWKARAFTTIAKFKSKWKTNKS